MPIIESRDGGLGDSDSDIDRIFKNPPSRFKITSDFKQPRGSNYLNSNEGDKLGAGEGKPPSRQKVPPQTQPLSRTMIVESSAMETQTEFFAD